MTPVAADQAVTKQPARGAETGAWAVRASLAVMVLIAAACGGATPAAPTASPTAVVTPSPRSAYPAGWAAGMCAAYGGLDTNPVDVTTGKAGRARIASALVALAKVPDWAAGDEARDALIHWYQQMSAAAELNDQDPLAAIQAQIDAFGELGTVGHSLDALQAATGEPLPCAEPAVSSSPKPSG